jgi:transcriptional regulator with XRE-family HTH domain
MPERIRDRGTRRGRQHLLTLATELRSARTAAGLSQESVARATGLSHAEISRIERGAAPWLNIVEAAELCAVLGLDLWLRAYAGGDPLRDAGHAALVGAFSDVVSPPLRIRTEVPLPRPGDPRAWDATVSDRSRVMGVEAETRLKDAQAFDRRVGLKRRDAAIEHVIVVLADTRANRSALGGVRPMWRADYPLDSAEILGHLQAGRLPPAGGIVLIQPG